jgi:squalene-hopene/tetraprenyl-beta-curcumene cyclase
MTEKSHFRILSFTMTAFAIAALRAPAGAGPHQSNSTASFEPTGKAESPCSPSPTCEQTAAQEPGGSGLADATPTEPFAERLSLARGAELLDTATLGWIRKQECASCHTGYPYLLARASLGDSGAPALRAVRAFFEDRVAAWDKSGKGAGYLKGNGPLTESEGVTEVVAIASALALHDAQSSGRPQPATRKALDRMWELQRPDGSWNWNKTHLAPFEYDEYFGAVVAALAAGHAPEGYAQTEAARAGLGRLRVYLHKNPPLNLHHQTWLLWASLRLDVLMDAAEKDRTVSQLLALQRPDGGWTLPALGDWKRRDAGQNDPNGPSDGYATGLVVYVLRQTGVPPTADSLKRAITWLKTHQRASGRWFTPSLNGTKRNSISNTATAFALLALRTCDVEDE